MTFEVVLTDSAARDLEELYNHIAAHDAPSKADHMLDKIGEIVSRLSELPERGHIPAELRALGIRDYRRCFFRPYRIIYRIFDKRVIIYCIADGRHVIQSFLQRRLLTVRCTRRGHTLPWNRRSRQLSPVTARMLECDTPLPCALRAT